MPMLHDAAYRSRLQARVRALRPDSPRRWGKMSVDQMLWHVSDAMEVALGTRPAPFQKAPLPRPIMKFVVLNLPWPRGAPTMPMFLPQRSYEFKAERDRCLRLIDALSAKRLEDEWPDNPVFGKVHGRDVSRLHAKHLNHHLTQFGV
jgi:hypothetical protein